MSMSITVLGGKAFITKSYLLSIFCICRRGWIPYDKGIFQIGSNDRRTYRQ